MKFCLIVLCLPLIVSGFGLKGGGYHFPKSNLISLIRDYLSRSSGMEWRLNRRSPGMDWRLNKRIAGSMDWRLNKRGGMDWRLNKRGGMDWRLNKRGMEWRLNKKSGTTGGVEDDNLYILERLQPVLETILQTQKKMQVMEELKTDSKFWEDQMNFPVMFQQLFRMGHMHTIIMKEMLDHLIKLDGNVMEKRKDLLDDSQRFG